MGLLDDAIREHLDLKRSRGADPAEIERAEREALGPVRREPMAGEASLAPPLELDSRTYPNPEDIGGDWDEHPDETDILAPPAAEVPPPASADKPAHGLGLRGRLLGRRRHEPPPPVDGHDQPVPGSGLGADELPGYEDYDPGYDLAGPEGEAETSFGTEEQEAPDVPGLADPIELEPPSPDASVPPAPVRADPTPPPPEPPAAAPSEPPSPPAGSLRGDTVEYDVEESLKSEGPDEDVLEETPEFLQDTPEHDRLWFEQRPPRDFDFDG